MPIDVSPCSSVEDLSARRREVNARRPLHRPRERHHAAVMIDLAITAGTEAQEQVTTVGREDRSTEIIRARRQDLRLTSLESDQIELRAGVRVCGANALADDVPVPAQAPRRPPELFLSLHRKQRFLFSFTPPSLI